MQAAKIYFCDLLSIWNWDKGFNIQLPPMMAKFTTDHGFAVGGHAFNAFDHQNLNQDAGFTYHFQDYLPKDFPFLPPGSYCDQIFPAFSIRPIWCYHLVVAEACETLCVSTAMLETGDVAVNM